MNKLGNYDQKLSYRDGAMIISDPNFKEVAEYVHNDNWSVSGPIAVLYEVKKLFRSSAIAGGIGGLALTSKFHPIRFIGRCSLAGSIITASIGIFFFKRGVDGHNELVRSALPRVDRGLQSAPTNKQNRS